MHKAKSKISPTVASTGPTIALVLQSKRGVSDKNKKATVLTVNAFANIN